jgi:hypothetical protein
MKKIMLIAFSIIMVMALAAPYTASAATVSWTDGVFDFAPSEGALTYGLSNNVYLDYTVESDYQDYAIATTHQAGNRAYTTTNNTTLIFFITKDTGDTSVSGVPSAGDTTGQIETTSWDAM